MSRRIFNLYVGGKNCGVYSVKTLVHQAISQLYPDITDLRVFSSKRGGFVPATYNTVCQHLTKNENGDKYPKCLLFSNKALVKAEEDSKVAKVAKEAGDTTEPKKPSPVIYIFEQEINMGPDGTKYNGTIEDMDPKWMASTAEWIGVLPVKEETVDGAAVDGAAVTEGVVEEAKTDEADAPVAIETTPESTPESTPEKSPESTPETVEVKEVVEAIPVDSNVVYGTTVEDPSVAPLNKLCEEIVNNPTVIASLPNDGTPTVTPIVAPSVYNNPESSNEI